MISLYQQPRLYQKAAQSLSQPTAAQFTVSQVLQQPKYQQFSNQQLSTQQLKSQDCQVDQAARSQFKSRSQQKLPEIAETISQTRQNYFLERRLFL